MAGGGLVAGVARQERRSPPVMDPTIKARLVRAQALTCCTRPISGCFLSVVALVGQVSGISVFWCARAPSLI
jgi:hypothetical protein